VLKCRRGGREEEKEDYILNGHPPPHPSWEIQGGMSVNICKLEPVVYPQGKLYSTPEDVKFA